MQTERYQDNPFGGLSWDRLGNWDYPFFMPALMPKTLDLEPATSELLMAAEAALGRLSGGAIRASDFDLLSSAVAILESLSSSKIEGTRSTLDEVLSNEVDPSSIRDEDLREVFNYLAAAEHGQKLLATLPISQRLFLQVQQILLAGVRGEEKTPGELRRSPVWVGSGVGPAEAEFIPPLPHLIPELLADWERFVNQGDQSVWSCGWHLVTTNSKPSTRCLTAMAGWGGF
jgi:Fic family protein